MRSFVYHGGVLGRPADTFGVNVQHASAVPHTPPPIEARRPLIVDHRVSLTWIQNLNADDLALLRAAIERAEAVKFNWREEWEQTFDSAREAIREAIPAFLAEYGDGTTAVA